MDKRKINTYFQLDYHNKMIDTPLHKKHQYLYDVIHKITENILIMQKIQKNDIVKKDEIIENNR